MLKPLSEMPIWARLVFKEQVETIFIWNMYIGGPANTSMFENTDWVVWPDLEAQSHLPMFFSADLHDDFTSLRSIHDVRVKGFETTDRLSWLTRDRQIIVHFSMDWIVNGEFKPFDYEFLTIKEQQTA